MTKKNESPWYKTVIQIWLIALVFVWIFYAVIRPMNDCADAGGTSVQGVYKMECVNKDEVNP